jgi:Protein of unknown function (DUF1549)/Protein of unknown function (DUF1553)
MNAAAKLGRCSRWVVLGAVALVAATVAWAAGERAARQKQADVAAMTQLIDREIRQRLDAEKATASPVCDDAEFIRRVSLDITGVIPPADRVVAFLDSADPAKRAKLIDELLASEHYGRHMADLWQALLLPRTSDNRRLQFDPMVRWLADRFNANKPWDEFVRELLTCDGTQEQNPAVTFFLANSTPDKQIDRVSRVFLGLQLQCAQCHNHPFTKWKQDEYWAMAAFFSKVRTDNPNKAAKQGTSPGINESGRGKQKGLPESAKTVPARFFQGEPANLDPSKPYRPVFARWLTAPENPFFAKAMVNRVWAQFFGRGLVNPVDDMHDGHPASHPELLQGLAQRLAAGDFDVKDLIRAICNSEAYQRTSKPHGENAEDETLFSHMAVKPLAPEQLYDSLTSILGNAREDGERRKGKAGPKGQPANARARFVQFFQADESASPTEFQSGIPQVLQLMNAPQMNKAAAVQALLRSGRTPAENLERLYLTALARRPTAAEAARLTDYVAKAEDARSAYGDILWALLNSSEFTLNH